MVEFNFKVVNCGLLVEFRVAAWTNLINSFILNIHSFFLSEDLYNTPPKVTYSEALAAQPWP